ncbi:DUF397 domain-containing protein [Nocardia tengchongensis]|uniref:DUF397 domain-containing protein n=1 Tax=Nocardia tengchongensis TaxID=2055889 RepID=UPI0036A2B29D
MRFGGHRGINHPSRFRLSSVPETPAWTPDPSRDVEAKVDHGAKWFKSNHSSQGRESVEVAFLEGSHVSVRHSKDPAGPALNHRTRRMGHLHRRYQ